MKPKKIEDILTNAIHVWSTMRPGKSFAGMTLAEFQAEMEPSLAARRAVVEAEAALRAARVHRDNADLLSLRTVQRVVAGVVADKDEGCDGAVYSALGFVRRSERASGLHRRVLREVPLSDAA